MSRYLTLLLCTLALVAGCSRDPERRSVGSPTGPSALPGSLLGASSVAPGGISGPMDVVFPGRNDSFDFRNQLETKYQTGLGRSASATVVDREGEVVWTQEYMRYRANGCDHGTANQRVLAQIDGNAPGAICGAPPDGAVAFPPRNEALDFRQQLEAKYAAMGRGNSPSFVDREGGVIWTQEYLRYRVNSCDHTTSVQKVFSQIDGGGVAATCFVPPCVFGISPGTQSVPSAGGAFTASVTFISGTCTYTAESLDSFVTLTSVTTGTATTTLGYSVAQNTGPARSGTIRVRWTNGSTLLTVSQGGSAVSPSFIMTDSFNGPGATTVCLIKSTATPCRFTATGNVTTGAVFTWTATYLYPSPTLITKTQTGASATFTFTETCSASGSATGTETDLNVTLTVTDPNNGTETIRSGSGSQPALVIKLFTC